MEIDTDNIFVRLGIIVIAGLVIGLFAGNIFKWMIWIGGIGFWIWYHFIKDKDKTIKYWEDKEKTRSGGDMK